MSRIFKRKVIDATNPLQEKAAGWFVAKILWLQNKWTLFMNRHVNRLSVRSKKLGLMVFVGLSVLVCIGIVTETFTRANKTGTMKIGNIRTGKHSSSTGEVRVPSSITQSQYKRIVAFHHYMDSLTTPGPGRKVFDSIMQCRPGLLDSVIILEKLYHSQNK